MRKVFALSAVGALALTACSAEAEEATNPIVARGSTTVAPITELIANDGGYNVEITAEGTTNGFDAFCTGDVAINNASEAIPGEDAETDYLSLCEENGVEFIELPIALDTLAVVRNSANDFAGDLTMDELQAIWEPGSDVTTWSDVREDWPDEEIELVGRPAGSGTFDYFTHHVNGEAGEIRDDYRKTDNLDQLATWISEDDNALGFMGIGNYFTSADDEVRDELATVSIEGVDPSLENAQNGTYTPLTRPLFIYVNLDSLEEDENLEEFVTYYVDNAYEIMPRTFFYRLGEDDYENVRARLEDRTTGSIYEGDLFRSEPVSDLLD